MENRKTDSHVSGDARIDYVLVTQDSQEETIQAFLKLGEAYLSELDGSGQIEIAEFLQSILKRQGEPDRWLFLIRVGMDYSGLVHAKIDREERPGWGYILEFGVVPARRRSGFGRKLFDHVRDILKRKGVSNVWLASAPDAEPFWRSLGFKETGLMEGDQKVLAGEI